MRDTFFAEAENRWLDVLYSMSYEQRPYPLTRALHVLSVSARDFPEIAAAKLRAIVEAVVVRQAPRRA